MNIRASILVLAIAYGASACATDDGTFEPDSLSTLTLDGGGTQFGATIDGVTWFWNVSWNDVKDTPDWLPGNEPGISVAQALQIARTEMVKYADSPNAYELDGVDMLPIAHCCNRDHERKWIYLVDFERRDRFPSGARGTIRIPVLLDGRAIQGTTEGQFGKVP